ARTGHAPPSPARGGPYAPAPPPPTTTISALSGFLLTVDNLCPECTPTPFSPSSSRCATTACRCSSGSARSSPAPAAGRCPAASLLRTRRTRNRSGVISPRRSTSASSPTSSSSKPSATPAATRPAARSQRLTSASSPAPPPDTRWHPVDEPGSLPIAFDHEPVVLAARERLRGKLSYTNIGFALAPPTFTISELRDLFRAALGHELSATNLQRVLLRRGVLKATAERREPRPPGRPPAARYRVA